MKNQRRKWLFPVLVAFLLSFALRLYDIKAPLIDYHSGRQIDTAMIAKNFYNNGFKIWLPQIDTQGAEPVFLESEFHIYPFIVSVIYLLLGIQDLIGRLVSVFFSSASVFFLYKIASFYFKRPIDDIIVFLYAISPLAIKYGRAFQPDATLVFFLSAGIYFFFSYAKRAKKSHLWIALLFITISGLMKLTSLYILLPLMYLGLKAKRTSFLHLFKMLIFILVVIGVPLCWYVYAHHRGMEAASWGIFKHLNFYETISFWAKPGWYLEISRVLFTQILPLPLSLLLPLGLFQLHRSKIARELFFWLGGVFIFYLVSAWSLFRHEYYHLPSIIPYLLICGFALDKMKLLSRAYKYSGFRELSAYLMPCFFAVFILIVGYSAYLPWIFTKDTRWHSWNMEQYVVGKYISQAYPHSPILISPSNISIYYANATGWAVIPGLFSVEDLRRCIAGGAEIFIFSLPPHDSPWQAKYSFSHDIINYLKGKGLHKIQVNNSWLFILKPSH